MNRLALAAVVIAIAAVAIGAVILSGNLELPDTSDKQYTLDDGSVEIIKDTVLKDDFYVIYVTSETESDYKELLTHISSNFRGVKLDEPTGHESLIYNGKIYETDSYVNGGLIQFMDADSERLYRIEFSNHPHSIGITGSNFTTDNRYLFGESLVGKYKDSVELDGGISYIQHMEIVGHDDKYAHYTTSSHADEPCVVKISGIKKGEVSYTANGVALKTDTEDFLSRLYLPYYEEQMRSEYSSFTLVESSNESVVTNFGVSDCTVNHYHYSTDTIECDIYLHVDQNDIILRNHYVMEEKMQLEYYSMDENGNFTISKSSGECVSVRSYTEELLSTSLLSEAYDVRYDVPETNEDSILKPAVGRDANTSSFRSYLVDGDSIQISYSYISESPIVLTYRVDGSTMEVDGKVKAIPAYDLLLYARYPSALLYEHGEEIGPGEYKENLKDTVKNKNYDDVKMNIGRIGDVGCRQYSIGGATYIVDSGCDRIYAMSFKDKNGNSVSVRIEGSSDVRWESVSFDDYRFEKYGPEFNDGEYGDWIDCHSDKQIHIKNENKEVKTSSIELYRGRDACYLVYDANREYKMKSSFALSVFEKYGPIYLYLRDDLREPTFFDITQWMKEFMSGANKEIIEDSRFLKWDLSTAAKERYTNGDFTLLTSDNAKSVLALEWMEDGIKKRIYYTGCAAGVSVW